MLSPEDQRIRIEAQDIREKLRCGEEGAAQQADELLTDLFPLNEQGDRVRKIHELYQDPPSSPNATILFDTYVEEARERLLLQPMSGFPRDIQDFRGRLVRFGGPFMKDFPMENLVLAGGSVLQCCKRIITPLTRKIDPIWTYFSSRTVKTLPKLPLIECFGICAIADVSTESIIRSCW